MKQVRVFLLAALLLFLSISSSSASDFRPMFRDKGGLIFSPHVGGYFFEPDQVFLINAPDFELDHSYSLGLRTGVETGSDLDIEANFLYVPTSTNRGDISLYIYHLDVLYNFLNFGRVTPYLDLGFGAMTFSSAQGVNQTDPQVTYAGGLKIFIIENLAFRLDVRGYTKFDATHTNFNFSGGITYYANFRKAKDTDADGYPDKYDLCPNIRESYNRYLDEDGCPEKSTEGEVKTK